jgi:hypothetical protein
LTGRILIVNILLQLICEQSDKICEMAAVMEKAAETDDKRAFSEQELVSKLTTENKVSMKCQILKDSALTCNI